MLVPGGRSLPLAEEFRMVKRQLLLTARAVATKDGAKAADRARMILVCSAQPDEGKTFCAINLALSMAAEKDVEILLVDADFAKPDVLERLGCREGPGLLDALAGDRCACRGLHRRHRRAAALGAAGRHQDQQRHRIAGERPRARDPRRSWPPPIRAAS
jgi:hypothetical protein